MSLLKIVHAADLHLDSPQAGLERYEGAPVEQVRGATRRALDNLVALCLAESVRVLVLAGDLYDGNWKDYSTGLFFASAMARLREAGVRVVFIRGNHDAASQITRHLRLPENVVELPTARAGTAVFEELGLAVHGQGFATRAVLSDLASEYPEPIQGLFNVGLLHTSANGRTGHEPYAPCSVEALRNKGYDYWALGHVHQREVLCEDPWIVFPGNLQGRHARELGPKGATLLTVEEGRVRSAEHRELDVVRWTLCEIDASEASSADDVVDLARVAFENAVAGAGGRILAARVRVVGGTAGHARLLSNADRYEHELRAAASDIGAGSLWLERVHFETEPLAELSELARRDDAVGQVARALKELRADPGLQAELLRHFVELRSRLPAELRDDPEGLSLDDPAIVSEALDDVARLIVPRLLSERDDEP